MHADQLDLSPDAVAALVAERLPHCRGLQVRRVESHGTVTQLFRLGPDLVLRFPLQGDDLDAGRRMLAQEADSARRLLGRLPVATPEPLMLGEPTEACPLPWAVYRWLPGTAASQVPGVARSPSFGEALAAVVSALWGMEVGWRRFDGSGRGGRLTDYDGYVDDALWQSRDLIDVAAVDRVWHRVRRVPRLDDDTWSHRDLMPGNLLVREGQLTAVLDVGGLARADPSLDLMPAWNLLEGAARQAFRDALGVDDQRWDRGKGWALVQAIGCLPYYRLTKPPMSELARHTLLALVNDEA